jgi:hypothetical protein
MTIFLTSRYILANKAVIFLNQLGPGRKEDEISDASFVLGHLLLASRWLDNRGVYF